MTRSEQINEIAGALAKAQGQMEAALKDSENPFFKSTYADLASVWDACRKPLSDNGLSVVQTTKRTDTGIVVTTLLAHTSGQWIQSELELTPKDDGPQAIGSAITYARRYELSAMVGVAPDDDDGEGAMGRKPDPKPPVEVRDVTKVAADAPCEHSWQTSQFKANQEYCSKCKIKRAKKAS